MHIIEYENYHEQRNHSDTDFPYNTYLCSIPLDFPEVPLHWHEEMELIYVKKGTGRITVDFVPYAVCSPALVLILPGQLHEITQQKNASMEYENIIFHPDILTGRNTDHTGADYLAPLFQGRISVPTLFHPEQSFFRELIAPIDRCDQINGIKPFGYELYLKSQLYLFCYLLYDRCRQAPLKRPKAHGSMDKLKEVIKYTENHYSESISIAQIARIAGFSESHFMRFFKETIGMTFVEYLRDYRLTMAARLLRGSDSAILDIAMQSGFDSLSYFNRSFKQKYGMSPKTYRRQDR